MQRRLPFLVALIALVACGSSTPEPAAPSADAAPAPAAASAEPAASPDAEASKSFGPLPTECTERKDNLCVPPPKFVKRLCSGHFPDVALSMFQKSTPWTRGYLRMNVEAWNASGGQASSDKLVFDEEVLVLYHRTADTGRIQVSGSGGGYDVLRWDGTCASLSDEELTLKVPPNKAKFAKISYKYLDEAIRSALESNDKVGKAVDERRKECKGATMGEVSSKCAKAEETVTSVIVDYVRGGGAIPAPTKIP